MPDAFFQKKRKRSTSSTGGGERSRASGSSSSTGRGGSSSRGRGRGDSNGSGSRSGAGASGTSRRSREEDDDEDDFDVDTADTRHRYDEDVESEEERDAEETPAEARARMAKMYLEGLRGNSLDPEDADAALADQENIASRLQKDLSEHSGRLHIFIASRIAVPPSDGSSNLFLSGGHRGPLTAAVASQNGQYIYTAGKDGNLFRWRMRDGRIDLLMPRRRRAIGKSSGKGKEKVDTATIEEMVEEEEEADEPAAAAQVDAEMHERPSSSTPRSKSSGASRRQARRAGAALNGKLKSSNFPAAASSTATGGFHEVVELGPEEGHTDVLWSLAVSSDGKIVVSGGADRRIGVWSITSPSSSEDDHANASSGPSAKWVKALYGHKDSITGLKFRIGTHELYSASLDRTIKLFDVDQLSYIETLFGHQESITSLDALRGEFALTSGGRDRTARWWKVREESQLVFRGGAKSKMRDAVEGGDLLGGGEGEDGRKVRGDRGGTIVEGSLECVAMIDEGHFLTGGDSGAISLWSLGKKKPNFSRAATHGFESTPRSSHTAELVQPTSSSSDDILTPRWITSLAVLPYSDLFASGSWDGSIRLWQLDFRLRSFKPLGEVKVCGFVNSIQIFQPPRSTLLEGKQVLNKEEWKWRAGAKGAYRPRSGGAEAQGSVESDAAEKKEVNGITAPAINGSGKTSSSTGARKELVPPILVAAIGVEPRTGRWTKLKGRQSAVNGAVVVPLSFKPVTVRRTEEEAVV
ncbi:WD40 repeat-like protein [Microstroma glucosiphilum]|uniref:WD40 repeat-like protein n=1 Tax=Pseudomicrostroma glucosiphilum TaxID=1684307 RepID=A0A316U670_9BASI|nr:WD40 repeat-like protein [Pseudomicrostroma glucosiphilum]PWN19833.1 WD40 repeat-like protein [Pseudomicrostroma glucosiphilum]